MRDIKMLNIEKNTINKLDNQVDETIDSEFKINKTTNILGKLASLIDDLTSLFNISFYVFLISKDHLPYQMRLFYIIIILTYHLLVVTSGK